MIFNMIGIGSSSEQPVIITTDTSVTLTNNTTTVIENDPTSVTVAFSDPEEDVDYICSLIFKAGSSLTFSHTAPTGYNIVWADGEPTWIAGRIYEIVYRNLWIDSTISAKWSEVKLS